MSEEAPTTTEAPAATSPTPTSDFGSDKPPVFAFPTTGSTPAILTATNTDDGDDNVNPEEECKAEFKPIVQLEEQESKTGEEDEEVFFEVKAKIFRFEGEWKERGVGMAKLLKHKESGKIRLLMRRDKTLKICANFVVAPGTELQEHPQSEKAWVFGTYDFAEETMQHETFCIRFGSPENANKFKEHFEKACEINAEAPSQPEAEEEEAPKTEAEKAADDLAKDVEEKAKVEEAT